MMKENLSDCERREIIAEINLLSFTVRVNLNWMINVTINNKQSSIRSEQWQYEKASKRKIFFSRLFNFRAVSSRWSSWKFCSCRVRLYPFLKKYFNGQFFCILFICRVLENYCYHYLRELIPKFCHTRELRKRTSCCLFNFCVNYV